MAGLQAAELQLVPPQAGDSAERSNILWQNEHSAEQEK